MWRDLCRASFAAAFWAVGLAMLIVASADSGRLVLAHWGIVICLGGATFTGWHLLAMERHRVETIAAMAVDTAIAHGGLDSIG